MIVLINKFTKNKNGMYTILLEDNSTVVVHEDIILKYDLLLKKKLDPTEKEKILKENLLYIAYDLSIKYISKKMRSKQEIRKYLEKKEVDINIIEETIKMLEKSKYISDETYASSYINDKVLLSNDGPNKIKRDLIAKDISKNVIDDKLKIFNNDIQLEKLRKISTKIISSNRNKSAYALKNKILEYLINLGYDTSLINSVLNENKIVENNDIVKREYEKVYNKLSKKYSEIGRAHV